MRKYFIGIILGILILIPANTFALTNYEKRQKCIEQCNKDYAGESDFDGAQRLLCRLGCDIAYLWNEIF